MESRAVVDGHVRRNLEESTDHEDPIRRVSDKSPACATHASHLFPLLSFNRKEAFQSAP